jgi:hypothetical protein
VFATVQTIEPRINACPDSLSHGLFLTCREEDVFLWEYNTTSMYMILIACVLFIKVKNNPLTVPYHGGGRRK